mmetsp:Transcript_15297/g.31108  ORF Transcript_15297/g.31108 Transcript_15297/m.31108 type:complete len:238 (-) Transcript_15297:137-850(-)|eukprot:scaffold1001_cov169-Amphora_coffeaeformis.AAC.25
MTTNNTNDIKNLRKTVDDTHIKFDRARDELDTKLEEALPVTTDGSQHPTAPTTDETDNKNLVDQALDMIFETAGGIENISKEKLGEAHEMAQTALDEAIHALGETGDGAKRMACNAVQETQKKMGQATDVVGGFVDSTVEKVGQAKDSATNVVGEAVGGAQDKFQQARDVAGGVVDGAKDKIGQTANEVSTKTVQAKDTAEQKMEESKHMVAGVVNNIQGNKEETKSAKESQPELSQ